MTAHEIDKLIAMLEPNAEENTVLYVRSEQQSVDIFEEWSPNDPRNW